ncbi:WD40 repeat domain-containing protein [Streptomyces phaeoluteigriseus]
MARATSADGTWLASGGDDTTVRLWDRATQTCSATLTGHYCPVTSVAIAPDGTCSPVAASMEPDACGTGRRAPARAS